MAYTRMVRETPARGRKLQVFIISFILIPTRYMLGGVLPPRVSKTQSMCPLPPLNFALSRSDGGGDKLQGVDDQLVGVGHEQPVWRGQTRSSRSCQDRCTGSNQPTMVPLE